MELDQGPWASGGNLGFGILGPMTVVRSSTLGDMLEGRAGGREWDGRLRYFRPMEKVVEGGIEEGKSGVEESEKIENSRVVDIEEEKNEIGDIEREGNESEQIEGEETEGDEISDSEGYETAPEQTEETEETDIATEDKKRKSETIDSAEAKKARLAQRKILEDEERYNVGTLEFIESQILVLDGRAVKDDCTARARKMLIEAGSIFSTGEKPSLWALERASELTIRAVVLARK
jgi:hypothetical protein